MTEETSYIAEFLEEISEILSRLDRQFVALEQNPSDTDCLAEIFRDLHTIKGSCGLLGLNKLESITHAGENLLGKLRDNELALRPDMVNTLLKMMDAVWKTVASLKKDGREGDADHSILINTLARLEKGESENRDMLDQNDSGSPPAEASVIAEFLEEAYEILDLLDAQVVELENNSNDGNLLSSLLRSFHTLKGSSGYMSFKKLEALTHSMENLLIALQAGKVEAPFFDCLLKMMDALRKILSSLKTSDQEGNTPVDTLIVEMTGLLANTQTVTLKKNKNGANTTTQEAKAEDANIRVSVELLDSLMNLVGEVVLARNQFSRLIQGQDDSTIQATSQSLNRVTTELQETVMKARMQPIKNVWSKLPRMVRDLSLNCGNAVRLEMEGQDSDLDKSLIMAIQDPLMNIIRNAIIHGIETGEERQNLGKPTEGVISLRAFNRSGQLHIEVQDDGRGVDCQAVKNKALDEKRITCEQAESLSDKDCGKLLFMRGFSLTQNSLMQSTKGNGLAQSRELIDKIGGSVDIEAHCGKGTTLKLKIPLTLAIIPALIVSCGSNRFAIPQINIKELIHLHEGGKNLRQTEEIAGSQFYRLRGNLLPLVELNQILKNDGEHRAELSIVVLHADDNLFGLVVDKIHNAEEIVVKTLDSLLQSIQVFSGAAIMGDGEIILILDVMGLAQNALLVLGKRETPIESASTSQGKDEEVQDMLIVGLGNNRRLAIRLTDVERLEEIELSDIETSGEEQVVQYRGEIMPLMNIPKLFNTQLQQENPLAVVVHIYEGKSLGLMVESILDIVPGTLDSKRTSANLLGTIIANSSVVDTLNVKNIVRNFLQTT